MGSTEEPVVIWIAYNLKDGVSRDQYRAWSRDVDRPAVLRRSGIRDYEVYEVEGAQGASAEAEFVEVIEADSWEAWLAVEKHPEMKEVGEQFWSMCDAESERILYGQRI